MDKKERIEQLVAYLNICSDEYYNKNNPSISDARFDALFDELLMLEKETGYVLSNSPTQRAGYEVLSALEKTVHEIPLLSLAKTKNAADIFQMVKKSDGYLALKLDGLTVKITYENGIITEAATRGDGNTGEVITHNARVFVNIPKKIPYKEKLVVTGEAFIDIDTFERINESIENDEDKYSTPRNLASGSVRQLDASVCAARGVKFIPFNVLRGFEDITLKTERLKKLEAYGFTLIDMQFLTHNDSIDDINEKILFLKNKAAEKGYPIDGIVFSYNDIAFCAAQGKTSHHFKDGIAFKFGDPQFKTVLRNIFWNISRTGQLTPIAEFDSVEIDNTEVSRASLHNITFIENLKLNIGDEILVSKRNMIIPHIERNLSGGVNGFYRASYPNKCPVCGNATETRISGSGDGVIKTLYCVNPMCAGKQIKKYTHFVSKPAMNIEGLSESTLEKFVSLGFIKKLTDIFSLPDYKEEIIKLEGFGEKSYENLCEALKKSRKTTLSNLLVAVNIPLLGKNAARSIEDEFSGSVSQFLNALKSRYDFCTINGFGSSINTEIYKWFDNEEYFNEFNGLVNILDISEVKSKKSLNGEFSNKTVVITGSFTDYTRDELGDKMRSLGAKVTSSVSKKTDFLLCGENAGSKLSKAKELGVVIITEAELIEKFN